MRYTTIATLCGIYLLAACGGQEEESPMPGMTAEEHAMHTGGGSSGATDSTGAVMRSAVHLTAAEERALGIVYTIVEAGPLARTIRTVGRIEAAEPRVADITPKIEGFVEQLFVSTTGEAVRRGQQLLTLYSPALVAAQEELLTAKRLAAQVDTSAGEAWQNAQATLEAARRRLAYWDITDEQITRVERTGQVTKTLTLVSPVSGIVLTKNVLEGQRVMPGERLYRIADLSTIWVEGDVFEQDLQFVREGQQAHIEVAAYPGVHMMGRVSFVYPTVDERSRTNRVRLTVPNPEQRLKPGMFATMYLDAEIGEDVISVPLDAVVATGERNLIFHRHEDGSLHPHDVVLGARAGDRVQVLAGLEEGEVIVASANFLIDAESRLAGTGGDMPGMQHAGHGSAIEPEGEHTQHADTMSSGGGGEEHRHD
ncbi:MAG: efflux RND transporter periplasmic adaptor subunit [Gemmatimonadetes bacterium]|nr:efflux RND transporter periplasmic adaptor subunit [Gemmatimonadota bacterium]NIO31496.1 efflux RND transporter periplasmic adaptor subunit [Gemmatimonadota bacterium]